MDCFGSPAEIRLWNDSRHVAIQELQFPKHKLP
jgi:hypothetical protein